MLFKIQNYAQICRNEIWNFTNKSIITSLVSALVTVTPVVMKYLSLLSMFSFWEGSWIVIVSSWRVIHVQVNVSKSHLDIVEDDVVVKLDSVPSPVILIWSQRDKLVPVSAMVKKIDARISILLNYITDNRWSQHSLLCHYYHVIHIHLDLALTSSFPV